MSSGRPYEGKLAIVTGGTRGLGAALVKRLAVKGCNVLFVYTSSSSVEAAAELSRSLPAAHGIRCRGVQADLLRGADAASLILRSARDFSRENWPDRRFQVDILVNNAGVSSNQRLNDADHGAITADEFRRVYDVNVLAPLLLTQAVAPFLPPDRSGRVVNVSSVSASIGYEGQSVYAATKAALEAMTRVWSRELAERATVNAVNPGPIWSDMYAKVGPKFWRLNQPYMDATPLARYGGDAAAWERAGDDAERFHRIVTEGMGDRRPAFTEEVAGTIDMLCSEESGWTTGSVICANGGMRMSLA